MHIETLKITPAQAKQWLSLVPDFQRRVDERQVAKIARAIAADEWRQNGATLVFNKRGELIDGQHRAHAIIKANRAVWSLVATEVDSTEQTFQTIDDSKARTVGDFLQCKNVCHVAAVARLYWSVSNGFWPSEQFRAPIADVLKLAAPHLEVMAQSKNVTDQAMKVTGFGAFLGFIWFYYRDILHLNASRVDSFFERLGSGLNLASGDPVAALRNRCLGQTQNSRIVRKSMFGLITKALNAHMRGSPLSRLRYEPLNEEFPKFMDAAPNQGKP
jgi:hypothetical protein